MYINAVDARNRHDVTNACCNYVTNLPVNEVLTFPRLRAADFRWNNYKVSDPAGGMDQPLKAREGVENSSRNNFYLRGMCRLKAKHQGV